MSTIINDLRHAVRAARKNTGQTILIVATLALAIGITTIGFSFADTLILRGFPVSDPDDTIIIFGLDSRQPDRRAGVFFEDYLEFRGRMRSVERLSAWSQSRSTLTRGRDTFAVTVNRVAGDLFGAWGIGARLGRPLQPGDDSPGSARVAVLADHYWQNTFGRSPTVVGETILLDGVPHEIVGVLDPRMEFGNFANVGVWASLATERGSTRDARAVLVSGRLAAGATVDSAASELAAIVRALADMYPQTNRDRTAVLLPIVRAMGGPNFWVVMALLTGAVILVMTIAAANVAGVLLAKAAARQREFGLRVALGARRSRVFRQLATEGLLLAGAGAAGGLLAAEVGLRLIRTVDAEPVFQQITIDRHELAFSALLAVLSPLVFSLAPAVAAMRTNLPALLNTGGVRSGRSGGRGRGVLVVAQIALAVTLVTVGGLVVRTATAMAAAPTGFDPSSLLVFRLTFDERSSSDAARRRMVGAIETRLQEWGADAVGALDCWPAVTDESAVPIEVDGLSGPPGQPSLWAYIVQVDAHALAALGVPIVAGRALTESDIAMGGVALVSVHMATRYFGSVQAAVGRRLRTRSAGAVEERQIVGITGDVRNTDPERGTPARVWVPLSTARSLAFVVRDPADAGPLARAVRDAVRELAPGVPLESLEPYEQAIARRTGSDRVIIGMLTTFAAAALLFAGTGLYGLVAYSVSQRPGEFGTRFALGAQVRDVAGLVISQAIKLLVPGLALGLVGGLAVANAMRSTLYGVTPLDPLNVASVVALVTIVTLAASLVPAWRAASVDIVDSLRAE